MTKKGEIIKPVNNVVEHDIKWKGFNQTVAEQDGKTIYDLSVNMSKHVYHKMFTYASLTSDEISGMGIVEREGSVLTIKDIFIFKQSNTGGSTELCVDDIANAQLEMINKGEDTEKMRLWWHSHCGMQVFWSGQDDKCCNEFDNGDWLLSIVVNHAREMRCRVDIYKPFRLTVDGIEVVVASEDDDDIQKIKEECAKEMEEKIEAKQVITYHPRTSKGYGFKESQAGWGLCGYCGQYDVDCMCVSNDFYKKDNTFAYLPQTISEFIGRVQEEYEEDGKTVPIDRDQIEYVADLLFSEIEDMTYEVKQFYDCFGLMWKWDSKLEKYMVCCAGKYLIAVEYVEIISGLVKNVLSKKGASK